MSVVSFSSLVECLQVRSEPTQVKHHSGALLQGRLLVLPTNIRLGGDGLPGTNALAYYKNLKLTSVKGFITFAPSGLSLQEHLE